MRLAGMHKTAPLALALVLYLPVLAQAQATSGSPQTSTAPTIQVFSRETIVDVMVTDAKGQPVHGLTQSDFTIEENGKPQPIRSFKEFGADAAAATKPLPKLPPGFQAVPATGPVQILLSTCAECPRAPRSASFGFRRAACTCCKGLPPTATHWSKPC